MEGGPERGHLKQGWGSCPRATAVPWLWKDEGPELDVPCLCGPRYLPLPTAGALDASLEGPLPRVEESVDILKAFVGRSVPVWPEWSSESPRQKPSGGLGPVRPGNACTQFTCLLHKAPPREAPAEQLQNPIPSRPKATLPVAAQDLGSQSARRRL